MFEKLKAFWQAFTQSLKIAFKPPVEDNKVQTYGDTDRTNFLAIFVSRLKNLTCTEATFEVESDSTQAEAMQEVVKLIQDHNFEIVENMLAYGECYIFPSMTTQGKYYPWILPLPSVYVVDMQGDEIYEAYAVVEVKEVKNKKYALIRHHKLEVNGDLTISYAVYNEQGKRAYLEDFAEIDDTATVYRGAEHIGFGRYKSPISSRGKSPMGVPLNFGCSEIEKDIAQCMEDIRDEIRLTKPKLFVDRSITKKKAIKYDKDGKPIEFAQHFDIQDDIFLIDKVPGVNGSLVDSFAPDVKYSVHYGRLINLFELYEAQVNTSKGILSPNESTATATATQVKRANADTLALVNQIRAIVDVGNAETLKAFNLSMNIPRDLWQYTSNWVDPFQDMTEQWTQIKDAVSLGVIEPYRATQWLIPTMTPEEAQEEIARIQANSIASTDFALESALKQ